MGGSGRGISAFIQVRGEAQERCSGDHEMVEPYFWRSFLASVWRTDCRGAAVQRDLCGRLLQLPGFGVVDGRVWLGGRLSIWTRPSGGQGKRAWG